MTKGNQISNVPILCNSATTKSAVWRFAHKFFLISIDSCHVKSAVLWGMLSGLFSRRITVCSPESFKTAHGGKEKRRENKEVESNARLHAHTVYGTPIPIGRWILNRTSHYDTPHFSCPDRVTNIIVDTVVLSYKWRCLCASGDNTLPPHFLRPYSSMSWLLVETIGNCTPDSASVQARITR